MLPSLKKDDVAVYYVSRTSNTDGVNSFLDKVDEVSSEPVPESWRSEVTFSTPALYIYIREQVCLVQGHVPKLLARPSMP